MKPGIPWSVKGIDGKAREIAKDAATSQGKTLGQWLNQKILESASEDADLKTRATRKKPSASASARNSRSKTAASSRGKSEHRSTPDESSIERKLDILVTRLSEMQEREAAAEAPQHALSAAAPATGEQASSKAMDLLLDRIEQGEQRAQDGVRTLGKRVDKIGDRLEELALRPVEITARDVPGFSALEGAVRNIVDHIEKSDKQSRDTMGQLQSRIVELDGKVETPSHDGGRPEIVADLEARMQELAARVEQTASGGEDLQLKALFEARIRELAERIDTVRHSAEAIGQQAEATAGRAAEEQANAIEARLAGLVEHAEQKLQGAGASDADLAAVHSDISELHSRFDQIQQQTASDQEVQALRSALEMLSSRVDETPGLEPIAQIEQRISDLSLQLQQVTQPADYQPQLGALEERILALDTQMAAASPTAIPQITTQMETIEHRLAATEQQLGSLATIENSIQQLFASLEESRAEARSLVSSGSLAASAEGTEPSAELQALQDGLAAVRANAETADQRTQATLEAVHETLAQIITKLSEVDSQSNAAGHAVSSAAIDTSAEADEIDALTASVAASAAAISAEAQTTAVHPSPVDETLQNDVANASVQPSHADALADAPGANVTAGAAPAAQGQPVSQEARSGTMDWLTVVRSHMSQNHGINSDVAMSMSPQTMAAAGAAGAADGHVDFIAAARQAATSSVDAAGNVPLGAAPTDFGGFDPHAGESDPEQHMLSSAVSGQGRSSGKKSASRAGSSRKRLILAAAVLLAAVSAYTSNSGLFNATPGKQSSASAPATPAATSMVEPAKEQKLQPASGGIELPTSGRAVEIPAATTPRDRIETDPMTTASVGSADTSDPLLSQAPDTLGNPVSAVPATTLPEQIGTAELRQAASGGDASAQFIIASRYLEGRKVGRDHDQAAQWYLRAAEGGLAAAQYRIGTLYERGSGVAQDRFQAMSWYAKAADQGNIKAMHNLAVMSADTANGKPDLAHAAKWFGAAAQHGLPDSQYNFAVLNERGLGIPKNIPEAYKWYSIAARSGDRDAVKKAQEMIAAVDKIALAEIDQSIASWKPTAPQREANMVSISEQSWGIAQNTNQASAKAPAGQTAGQPLSAQDRIKRVQELLTQKGFNAGTADGEMTSGTANAIRLYQLRNGLPVNGFVSKQLLEHLQQGLI